ncbi:putative ABC transporter [Seiridium unicorne]|uniref:ABC transporter n=1 Tax=Seiridium unicorne TaxID=138068 RepID=A0ABR2VAW2_9PEZI
MPANDVGRAASSMLCISLWVTLCMCIVFVKKWLFSDRGFNYPAFETTCHLLFNTICTQALLLTTRRFDSRKVADMSRNSFLSTIFPVAVCAAFTYFLGDAAYIHLNVAAIHVIKALTPVVVFILLCIVSLAKITWIRCLDIAVISGGIIMASAGWGQPAVAGIIVQVASTFTDAARLVGSQRVLTDASLAMEPLVLLSHVAPWACFISFGPLMAMEAPTRNELSENWQLLVGSCLLSFCLDLAGFSVAFGLLLSATLFLYWTKLSTLNVPHQAYARLSLFASSIAALGLSFILFLGHQRFPRLSYLATRYLFAAVMFDIVYLTMPTTDAGAAIIHRMVLLRCGIQSALLVLEYGTWGSALEMSNKHQYAQDQHGLSSRLLFLWINPILLRGYRDVLRQTDMPRLSGDMMPESTRKAMVEIWSQRVKPETSESLPRALMGCLKTAFLAATVPRLLLIFFRYSQPVLINQSIKYATADPNALDTNHGYWLIVSAVAIYVGIALSTATYQNCLNRLKLMTRSALVGLIHDHTMKSASVAYDNGAATTLMSTDADTLEGIGEMVHEIWAQVVEVVIGIILLAGQVGWIWPLPLVLIYLCSHMSRFVAKHLQPGQKAWNNATQDRIAALSSALQLMKVIKMLGFQDFLSHRIQNLREFELQTASKLRWVMVYYNASANALGLFSPAITLVIFAVISAAKGRAMDTATAFTTVAILGMVTHPANMVMTMIPRVVAALSGFERIQAFLLRAPLEANRSLPDATSPPSGPLAIPGLAVQLSKIRIGYPQVLLDNVNINAATGKLTIVSGPTGSGKSTLLRVILGEAIPAHGKVSLSSRQVAYCAQRPWLPNGTIREVIYGAANSDGSSDQYDKKRYDEVVNMCSLAHDLNLLADGDQTQIGSRGLNLSGGQRQRVALARALFAACDIILLDDTFSGLDGETEQTVFNNLFAPNGLLRRQGTTAVLVSNSTQYFPAADHIVILGDRGIIDQGSWQDIKVKATSIAKFSSSHGIKENAILSTNFEKLSAQLRAKDETEIELARQTGDIALYGYYLRFIHSSDLLYLLTCVSIYSFCNTIPQYWLQLWTESDQKHTAVYVGGYLFLSAVSWISTSTQAWVVLIRLSAQSGLRLHRRLLSIVLSAPLSFFSKTDNGSILNRFSQDIQLVDKQLPSSLQMIVVQLSKLIMQAIVLCMAEKWLLMLFPGCMVLVYLVQKVYLRTSRQLRYLELDARATVFSSFLESVEGLETIRAFGWSRAVIQSNILSVENSQRPEFLLLCLQRWLNIILDLLTAGIATTAIAIAVVFREHVSGAQVGIALNIMLVANTTLLKLVENWTILEISLGAIARLKTLEKTTPVEGAANWSIEPPANWPSKGQIEFKNISAAYQHSSDPVAIKDLCLNVNPGQKLIVCGRTGSGKSTLLLTLLRILEIRSGKIKLDGIDIKNVSLNVLRQRCFIAVSQDPLILPQETLRFNLDPGNSALNDTLVGALNKVGLWSHLIRGEKDNGGGMAIPSFAQQTILDQKVSNLQELSVGQCQLFAICRTLVKAGALRALGVKPVVVLDEVTSSLDTHTESIIYRIVDEEFTQKGHTVIIIAHRLGGLQMRAGTDAVAFMADGSLQEVRSDPSTLRRFTQMK